MYSAGLEINIFSRSLQVSPSPSPSSTSFFANVYFARISLILYVLAHILHIYLRVHAYNFQYQRNFHRLNCRQATSRTRRTSTLRFSRWFEIHGRRGLNASKYSSLPFDAARFDGGEKIGFPRSFRKIFKDPWKAICPSSILSKTFLRSFPRLGGPPGAGNDGIVRS